MRTVTLAHLILGLTGATPLWAGHSVKSAHIESASVADSTVDLRGSEEIFADGLESGDTSAWSSPVGSGADLGITKRNLTDPTTSPIVYIVTVTNHGPATAEAAGFLDDFPSGTFLIGWSGASCDPFWGVCALGDLPNGAVREVTLHLSAPAGQHTNHVTVLSSTSDSVSSNDTASEQTTVTSSSTSRARHSNPACPLPTLLSGAPSSVSFRACSHRDRSRSQARRDPACDAESPSH